MLSLFILAGKTGRRKEGLLNIYSLIVLPTYRQKLFSSATSASLREFFFRISYQHLLVDWSATNNGAERDILKMLSLFILAGKTGRRKEGLLNIYSLIVLPTYRQKLFSSATSPSLHEFSFRISYQHLLVDWSATNNGVGDYESAELYFKMISLFI